MRDWHKILVAPGVAIVFLIMLGAISYGVLLHQHSALAELFNTGFGNYERAVNSSQDISRVYSSVYRLSNRIGNVEEDTIKQITNDKAGTIGAVIHKEFVKF